MLDVDHVRVRLLGVTMSSDLSLEKHVSAVSAVCFFHQHFQRQLKTHFFRNIDETYLAH